VKKIELIVALAYTLALAYFSLVPVPKEVSSTVKVSDIIQHFAAYFTLTFLWYIFWRKVKYSSILSLVVGALTELAQSAVPYRVFSLADLAANTAGVVVSTLLIVGIKHCLNTFKNRVSETVFKLK